MKKKIDILVIEDFKHDYLVMERTLQRSDIEYKIDWVQRGEKVIQKLKSSSFDIVLIDYKLPDEDGLEVFRKIKREGIDIPVVFITASGNELIAAEAIKSGAQDYIVKDPLGRYLDVLPSVIKKALSQWEAEQERKQAEEALKATNEKLTMLAQTVTSMKEYVSITNIDGKIFFVNHALLDKYGYKRDEILGKPSEIFHSPHNPKVMRKRIHEGTLKGVWKGELLNQTKDGKEFPVELSTSILKDKNGKSIALIGIAVDITERKQAEQIQSVLYKIANAVNTTESLGELYHTIHQLLGTVIDVKNFYIALYDEDKNTIFFPYYVDDKDTKPEPVPQKLSKGLTEYVIRTGKSLLAPKEYYMRLAKEGKIEISGSISEVWIGIPLRIENKTIGVMAVQSYKDASVYNKKDLEILELISYEIAIAIEHKKMEQINIRLSEIIRNARDGIILTNPDSQITYVNPAYEKMSGYTLSELLKKDPADFIVTEDTAAIANEIRSAVKALGEWKGELYCIRKNEEVYPIDTRVFAIKNEKRELVEIAAIQQDITERKQAENIQRALYDISNAINTTDNMHLLCKNVREFLGNVIDTKNFYIALYDKKTDVISLPFEVDEKDTYETFPAGKTLTKYVIQLEKPLFAPRKLQDELIEQGKIDIVGSPSEIWLGVPLKIENKVIGVIAVQSYDDPNLYTEKDVEVLTFVSEEIALAINRKQAEEELKINRERLKTANSILRHDIANDVIVIKSALDIYRDEQDETMLDEIEKRVEKSLNTIQKQRDQEQFIDSHSGLDEYQMEKVAHDVIKNYPNIKFSVTGTGLAYADNAIYSVFENIISNAIKHGKTNKLDIGIGSGEEFCEIRFADYGIGIPDEYKNDIFNEGFQYGETGHTGIGLYIAKQTVKDYDGEVSVEDNKPNGAVFIVRLKKVIER